MKTWNANSDIAAMRVEDYIEDQTGEQKQILRYLHRRLTQEFGLEPKIRYGIPFYYGRSWICYLNPVKNDGIELAFINGNDLSNTQGILHSKERKQVCGIEVFDVNRIPEVELDEVLHEAVLLDEAKSSSSKRKLNR